MTGTRADVSGPMKAILEELQALMPGSQKLAEKHGRVLAQEVVGTVNIPYAFYGYCQVSVPRARRYSGSWSQLESGGNRDCIPNEERTTS